MHIDRTDPIIVPPKADFNYGLIQQVLDHIQVNPLRGAIDRYMWQEHLGQSYGIIPDQIAVTFPGCGTIACFYGWGKILSQPDPAQAMSDPDISKHLCRNASDKDIMALFQIDEAQANNLCFIHNWPLDYWEEYRRAYFANDQRAMGLAMVERGRFFLRTMGTDDGLSVYSMAQYGTEPVRCEQMRQFNEQPNVGRDRPYWMRDPASGQFIEIEDYEEAQSEREANE